MVDSSDKLTGLQREILRAFFARERGFFLTGGAALAGFYLGHRATSDLDLFTASDEAFERGPRALDGAAATLGATVCVVQDAPDFKRLTLSRDGDLVVVDLVRDRTPAVHANKPEIDGVIVDPIEEIVINKLNTVVSRTEERDLVDLLLLERAGYRIDDYLDAALTKDGGCTPATLAWVLSEVEVPDAAELPGGVDAAELRDWLRGLVVRLRRAAAPRGS